MDRFTRRDQNGKYVIPTGSLVREAIDKLAFYEDAEERGHMITLPCKVGDPVFYLTGPATTRNGCNFDRVEMSRCAGFYFDERGIQIRLANDWEGNHGTYGFLGKTVFTVRFMADAALRAMRGGDDRGEG